MPSGHVPPGFAFYPVKQQKKKAKDSGGGTPGFSGRGSNPCGVFALILLPDMVICQFLVGVILKVVTSVGPQFW